MIRRVFRAFRLLVRPIANGLEKLFRVRTWRNIAAIVAWLCLKEEACNRNLNRLISDSSRFNEEDLALIAVFVVSATISIALSLYLRRTDQRKRNSEAQSLAQDRTLTALNAGEEVAFVLYLRPFAADNSAQAHQGIRLGWKMFLDAPYVRIDEYLLKHLESKGLQLVALGYSDLAVGAGKVETSDSEWRNMFRRLADAAIGIAVVPGLQSGIVEEIGWLRLMGHFRKTTFLKPVNYSRRAWTKIVDYYSEEEGFVFPDWSSKLILFQLYDSGAARTEWTLLPAWWERMAARALGSRLENADRIVNQLFTGKD